ncbi:hypothetical protein N7516_000969 [Penicillium verrucosum]|uniref:uncharacterized protein n=1 Tax=Penicillium verrucosum TaxID=60171 RepID=UPI0025458EE1|nr:uncharacterized protein N7516_000969 [Penicillium verrucosum]KAJ5940801.1 hypothetical protein N7516_000969 [Penicillium verrucosum]
MRFYLPATLFLSALSAAPALAGQEVVAVWSGSTFSTASNSGEHVWDAGFSLIDKNGEVIYNEANPDGYKPCIHMGQEFQLEGGCLGGAWYSFRCKANPISVPEECEVMGPDGKSVATGDSDSSTDYFGLGISMTGACRVNFELWEGIDCENGSGDLVPHHTGWHAEDGWS